MTLAIDCLVPAIKIMAVGLLITRIKFGSLSESIHTHSATKNNKILR